MKKYIIITGASSGFGRDTAETLAAAGHAVFAGVRDGAERNLAVAGKRSRPLLGIPAIL
jgi:NAD(P)-dependent dehydrogenase (short-subunit alcohol dehydrogenase family)